MKKILHGFAALSAWVESVDRCRSARGCRGGERRSTRATWHGGADAALYRGLTTVVVVVTVWLWYVAVCSVMTRAGAGLGLPWVGRGADVAGDDRSSSHGGGEALCGLSGAAGRGPGTAAALAPAAEAAAAGGEGGECEEETVGRRLARNRRSFCRVGASPPSCNTSCTNAVTVIWRTG